MALFGNLWDRLTGRQANPLDAYIMQLLAANAIYPDESKESFLNSYTGNNDTFTIINKIVEPASTVPIYQYDKNGEEVNGRMIQLINSPNPYQSQSQFIEAALTFYYIFGESFTAGQTLDGGLNAGQPLRLDQLPPQLTKINLGTIFNPVDSYEFYPKGGLMVPYQKDMVLHWKEFNPDYNVMGGHLRGMSRLRPLLKSITGSSEAYNSLVKAFQAQGMWGLLTMLEPNTNEAVHLTKEQKSALKHRFKIDSKKGDLTIINSLAKYEKMGLTIVELEVIKALGLFKGNLCDAFNVPSQLLAGSTDRTYNNYKEAEESLWRNAIQPSLNAYLEGLTNWLAPLFGEQGTYLQADYSGVSCLQENIKELVGWMVASKSFSKNEIREAAGYDRIKAPGMDDIYGNIGDIPIADIGIPPDNVIQ